MELQEIAALLTILTNRFASVETKIDKKFDKLEASISIIDNRLNSMDSRLNTIDTRLSNIEQRLGRIEKCVSFENADFVVSR